MTIDESILSKLTDEQKKKAQSAQSPDELLAIVKEAYELSAEQLEAIAGGKWKPCWTNCLIHGQCPYFE